MGSVFIYGSGGGSSIKQVEKTVDLSLASGNQTLTPDKGEAFSKVTINKPSTLVSTNILSGVNIGGVVGNVVVSNTLPTLNKVTISRSSDTISISNPSSNGSYVSKYRIYSSGAKIKEQTGTSFSLIGLGKGSYELTVAACANYFNDSPVSSSIKATVYSIGLSLTNLTSSNSATLISDKLEWSTTLSPTTGYYLPEDIEVTMGGSPCTYEYNSYKGTLAIKSVTGDIAVTAAAYTAKKLRRPTLSVDDTSLTVTPPRFAEVTNTYIDGTLAWTYEDIKDYVVSDVSGSTYGFELNDDEYYESNNQKKSSTYALCKVTWNLTAEKTVTLRCISYGESSYDYGLVSQIDQTLSASTNDDGSTGSTTVLKNFKGLSSATPVDLSLTIPSGEHFIYCKYKKDGSGDTGNDSFQFKVME